MASRLGMILRTEKANERIDAAMAALAKGSEPPTGTRNRNLDDVLRLEWIADSLESLAGIEQPETEAPAEEPTNPAEMKRAELNDYARSLGLDPDDYKNAGQLREAIAAAQPPEPPGLVPGEPVEEPREQDGEA